MNEIIIITVFYFVIFCALCYIFKRDYKRLEETNAKLETKIFELIEFNGQDKFSIICVARDEDNFHRKVKGVTEIELNQSAVLIITMDEGDEPCVTRILGCDYKSIKLED